jgi:transcriptional regulator with XRE-family HTH domain
MRTRKWVASPSYKAAISGLIAARKQAGMTQRDLAASLKKPPSWVAKVEQRERRLDLVEFVAVARALGQNEIELFRSFLNQLPKRLDI